MKRRLKVKSPTSLPIAVDKMSSSSVVCDLFK